MRNCLSASQKEFLRNLIDSFALQRRSYAIYGTGNVAIEILELVRELKLKPPTLVIDHSDSAPSVLAGVEVRKLDKAAKEDFDEIILATNLYEGEMRLRLEKTFSNTRKSSLSEQVRAERANESEFFSPKELSSVLSKIYVLSKESPFELCGAVADCARLLKLLKFHGLALPSLCRVESSDGSRPTCLDGVKCEGIDSIPKDGPPLLLAARRSASKTIEKTGKALDEGRIVIDLLKDSSLRFDPFASLKIPFVAGGSCLVEPTSHCNLRCKYCGMHSPHLKKELKAKSVLSLERFETLLSHLEGHIASLELHGNGEPLLNPELPEMIEMARSRIPDVRFTTNGMLLSEEKTERLGKSGLANIRLSLDGLDATYNRAMRGIDTETVLSNAERFSKKTGTPLSINCVLTAQNAFHAHSLPSLKRRIPSLNYVSYVRMGKWESLDCRDSLLDGKIDFVSFERFKRLAALEAERHGVLTNARDLQYRNLKGGPCRIAFGAESCQIDCDGRLHPCCITDFACGNVFETGFMGALNSEEMLEFRRSMLAGRRLSECHVFCNYAKLD